MLLLTSTSVFVIFLTEIYAGRVSCCPLVSHVEYAPRALLRFEKRWADGRTGCQTVTLRLPLDAASVLDKWIVCCCLSQVMFCPV